VLAPPLALSMVAGLVACSGPDDRPPVGEGGPLGMVLPKDGKWRAGAASVDITPEIPESWSDLNGDNTFNGSLTDPDGPEPFDDADGDGVFDAVWIGGFGPLRAAQEVHDHTYARAVVLSVDGEYVAFVALDLVGLGHPRIWQARDALAADGFDPDRLLVASSHSHDGPDTVGLWGNPLLFVPGFDPVYQQRVAAAIEDAVREAAASMEEVDLNVGSVRMRDRGPWFNGEYFGGKNPDPRFHGMVHDGRDPVVVSDQLLVLQGVGADGAVFTLTNWSGHPEVRGSNNNAISSDWPGVTREVLEAEYGGLALHLAESLGGMQSALSGHLPLVNPDGTHVLATCTTEAVADPTDADCFGEAVGADRIDADGDHVPVWAPQDTWEFVTSHGWHIGEAAIDALSAGEPVKPALQVGRRTFSMPITNAIYNMWGPQGIFDYDIDQAVTDPERCPEVNPPTVIGCFEPHVFRVELGHTAPGEGVGLLSIPGELLPELAWGLPDDATFTTESEDLAARGEGATYFPQADPDCRAELDSYEDCRFSSTVGSCDCLSMHTWPYRLSDEPGHIPLLDHLDTEHRAMLGMTDTYFGYIIPEPDFNRYVSLFTDDGDHYEDTVSGASVFGDRVLQAHEELDAAW
jgi:hypothetical protein